jgi:hypothetical protein
VKPRSRANSVRKDGWKLNSRRKRKNKFVANVPMLLLEVSLCHQFFFPTIISQLFGVNESAVPYDMQNYFEH